MTDKKRGRPKGSTNKPKLRSLEELGKAMEEGMKEPEVSENISKALVSHFGDGSNVKPLPSNWNDLGKLAKLQWLTEHRK